jgi:hypothetical protein
VRKTPLTPKEKQLIQLSKLQTDTTIQLADSFKYHFSLSRTLGSTINKINTLTRTQAELHPAIAAIESHHSKLRRVIFAPKPCQPGTFYHNPRIGQAREKPTWETFHAMRREAGELEIEVRSARADAREYNISIGSLQDEIHSNKCELDEVNGQLGGNVDWRRR